MKVREGFKYVVDEDETYPIPDWFPPGYRFNHEDDRIKLDQTSLTIKRGFAYNGANAFPDYDWIVVPSAIHDAMLWVRHYHVEDAFDENFDIGLKSSIDRWFTEESKKRMPKWRRWATPTGLYFAVNVLSKLSTGPDQAEAHKVREYV